MDIRVIVFGMCFVLAALFIGAKFFVPHEKRKSKLEANYFEAAQRYFKEPNEQNYKECLNSAKDLPHLFGKSEAVIKEFLSSNKIHLS